MGEDEEEPRWFYVGNGQLRRKDSDGWTDEYQELDGPKRAAVAHAGESTEVPETVVKDSGPGLGARALSSLGRLCSAAAHGLAVGLKFLMVSLWHLIVWLGRLIAKGYRLAAARARPRRGRHRSGAQRALQPAPQEADRPSEAMSPSSPG